MAGKEKQMATATALGGAAVAATLGLADVAAWWLKARGLSIAVLREQGAALGGGAVLLLGAVALTCRRQGWWRCTAAAAATMIALGVAALLTTAFATPDLSNDSPRSLQGFTLRARPMTPLAALAAATAGAGLLLGALPLRRRLVAPLISLGGVVAVVAGVALLALLADWVWREEPSRLSGMSPAAALGLLAVGLAMLAQQQGDARGREADDGAPLAGLAFAVVLALSFLAFQWLLHDHQAQVRARFRRTAINVVDDIGDRIPAYALALRAGAWYLQQAGPVAPPDFAAYVQALQIRSSLPGILGFSYVESVPTAELSAHVRRQAAAWPGYAIHPPGSRARYFPVVMLGPDVERGRPVIGFDHYAEPTRRAAIDQAIDSGEPTLTRSVALVVDRDKPHEFGFHIYQAVYRPGMPVGTVEERRRALAGLLVCPFRISELMPSILLDRYESLRVRVLDGEFHGGARLVFDSAGAADGALLHAPPRDSVAIGALVLGRRWTVLASPLPAFFSAEPGAGAWLVLGSGVLIALLLGAAIHQMFATRARARALAAAQALQAEAESRLRAEQALHTEREEGRRRVEALNRELSRRAAELEQANRDLEAFSYSVSHDLQQPVTSIAAYAGMALEDFAAQLGPDVKEILERIQAASFRMSRLISGLLALSSLARQELALGPVDLTALAREALTELEATQNQRQIEVIIAEGLTATGDRRLLQILVTNLLSNAWKYTGKTERPRIEMGRAETEHGPAFYVRDNGVGFDMAKAGKLFDPFQRLHKEADFSGTGIGLATVHRIVTRHGGRIWAQGKPGEGATFYFALP
jgi:hypothetical protein